MATSQGHDSPISAPTEGTLTDEEMPLRLHSETPELSPVLPNTPGPSFSAPHDLVAFMVGEPDVGMEDPQIFQVYRSFAEYYKLFGHELLFRNSTPGAFELLLEWMYTGKIGPHLTRLEYECIMDPVYGCGDSAADCEEVSERAHKKTEDRLWFLLHLYVLAEGLHIPVLQNLATDQLIYMNVKYDGADPRYRSFVMSNTKFGSPLRNLIIVQLAENPISLLLDLEKSFYGWDRTMLLRFIEEAIPRMRRRDPKDGYWKDPRNRAKYHVPE